MKQKIIVICFVNKWAFSIYPAHYKTQNDK